MLKYDINELKYSSDYMPGKHDGYETVIVGDDVVLIEIDTGKIADIITDAVLGS